MVQSRSPQKPGDVVIEAPDATPRQVSAAAAASRSVQHEWWNGPAATRAQALARAADVVAEVADELTALVIREVGKPRGEARGEVARAVAILRYYSQQVFDPVGAVHEPSSSGLLYTRRYPHGVAGLITPWNFPIAIPLWKAAPALAFGNSVVLKPAPEATACATRLVELLGTVLPDGLVTILPGDAEPGSALVAEADVVSFTGSIEAGHSVAAAATERGIPVQAEMGGQNPAIVLPDADLDAAARQIAAAAMGYAGQKCTATKRVIVVGDTAPFRDALVSAVEAMPNGDPAETGTTVGPVISEAARASVVDAADDARRTGGTILTGGTTSGDDGWFVQPTVVEGVPSDHRLACQEVFGPICLLQSAADLDEAVRTANGVRHGLVAAVYTRDLTTALAAGDRLHAGMVKVNAPTAGVDYYLPFGGDKASSVGQREQGKAAQDFYTATKTITIAPG